MPVIRPEDLPKAFVEAWMNRDASALAALFADDADFVNVVGIWWQDRTAIEKAHDYALRSFFSETKLIIGRVKLRQVSDDVAVVHARMVLSGQKSRDSSTAGRRNTILSFVLQRQADGWVCLSAQNTDIVPDAETVEARDSTLTPRDYRT